MELPINPLQVSTKTIRALKKILWLYTFVSLIGVSTGLIHLKMKSGTTPQEASTHYRGDELSDPDEIPENYPMDPGQLLVITHSHLTSMAMLWLITGLIFLLVGKGIRRWKTWIAAEPLISLPITFGSIWLVRYYHADWIYLTIVSSALMYLSFYFMSIYSLFYLSKKAPLS